MEQTLRKIFIGLQGRAIRDDYPFKEPEFGNYKSKKANRAAEQPYISFRLPKKSGPLISTVEEMTLFLHNLAEELQVEPTYVKSSRDSKHSTRLRGILSFEILLGTKTVSTAFELYNPPTIFGEYATPIKDTRETVIENVLMTITVSYKCRAPKK